MENSPNTKKAIKEAFDYLISLSDEEFAQLIDKCEPDPTWEVIVLNTNSENHEQGYNNESN